MVGIYRITSPSGRVNIGQTWNIEKRIGNYKRSQCYHQPKVIESIKRYGWDNHKFEILQELPEDITQEVLDQLEVLFIQQYKDCGFKMMNIKEGGRGGKHSDETKKKISNAGKGRKLSKDHAEKLKSVNIGKTVTEETRRKIGDGNKGKVMSEEAKLKIGIALRGRIVSDATKQLLKEKNTGRKMTIEQIEKMKKNKVITTKGVERIKIICPKCGKEGGIGIMQRWHFDNCEIRIPMSQETRDKIANTLSNKNNK